MSLILFLLFALWASLSSGMELGGSQESCSLNMHRFESIKASDYPLEEALKSTKAMDHKMWSLYEPCAACWRVALEELKRRRESWWYWFLWWKQSEIKEEIAFAASRLATIDRVNALQKLVQEFPEAVNSRFEGYPALSRAVIEGNSVVIKELLNLGADPNQPCQKERVYAYHTPLMLAVNHQHLQRSEKINLIEALLAKGARINDRHKVTLETALLLAKGDSEIIECLIDHGAYIDYDAPDTRKVTLEGGKQVREIIGSYSIFEGIQQAHPGTLQWSTKNYSQMHALYSLLEKIFVRGAIGPCPRFLCADVYESGFNCRGETLNGFCVRRELVLQRVLRRLEEARIPRQIRVKILSKLPLSQNMLSASMLRLFNEDTTAFYNMKIALWVPISVLQRDSKHYAPHFIQRISDAYAVRKIVILKTFFKMLCQYDKASNVLTMWAHFMPDLWLDGQPTKKLEDEIRAHYKNLLTPKELSE